MAGHSHWANIAHKKSLVDAKRGRLWSKLSRAIMVAARHGGVDPESNLKLRYAIDKAREVSMPKENIERAIKRGAGESAGEVLEDVLYEGYAPGGVAVLVDILTDNRNRTASEIRKIFERAGGHLGSAGCVSYLFERKGLFVVPAAAIDEDALIRIALEAGAEDIKSQGDSFEVLCDPSAFGQVTTALADAKITPSLAQVSRLGKILVDVDVETGKRVLKLIEALDDHDDVQGVSTNLHVTEAMTAGI
jgi:YebC/PmpR family DNA-binding regulatory protein